MSNLNTRFTPVVGCLCIVSVFIASLYVALYVVDSSQREQESALINPLDDAVLISNGGDLVPLQQGTEVNVSNGGDSSSGLGEAANGSGGSKNSRGSSDKSDGRLSQQATNNTQASKPNNCVGSSLPESVCNTMESFRNNPTKNNPYVIGSARAKIAPTPKGTTVAYDKNSWISLTSNEGSIVISANIPTIGKQNMYASLKKSSGKWYIYDLNILHS